jgi:hypothetical protein
VFKQITQVAEECTASNYKLVAEDNEEVSMEQAESTTRFLRIYR